MTKSEQSRRLRELRKTLNLSQLEFGRQLGIRSRTTISTYEESKVPNHILDLVCNVFPVNKTWLLTGQGDMLLEPSPSRRAKEERSSYASAKMEEDDSEAGLPHIKIDPFVSSINDNFIKLNMYHITGAGDEMVHIEFEPVGQIVIPKYLYKEHYIPMKVIGDSMEKLIMNLSVVMIDPSPQPKLMDKKIYCFRIPYSGFIIRQANTEPDGLYLEPFNKQYKTTKIEWSDFDPEIVIGRVVCNLINIIG